MYSFDKHAIASRMGPMGLRYSLSPLMSEQNAVQRYADGPATRAHNAAVVQRESEVKLTLARTARVAGGHYTSGIKRRPQGQRVA